MLTRKLMVALLIGSMAFTTGCTTYVVEGAPQGAIFGPGYRQPPPPQRVRVSPFDAGTCPAYGATGTAALNNTTGRKVEFCIQKCLEQRSSNSNCARYVSDIVREDRDAWWFDE